MARLPAEPAKDDGKTREERIQPTARLKKNRRTVPQQRGGYRFTFPEPFPNGVT
jgi:hypothetical protein